MIDRVISSLLNQLHYIQLLHGLTLQQASQFLCCN